jgi:HAD superfamily hydrolase (TIGR01509 family)
MARIRAVLFDIDGTLLDSNDAHAHAWLDALRGHGRDVPYDLVRSKIGMGGDKLLAALAKIDHESEEGKSITERRVAILKAHYLADVGPFPGARSLVDRIRSRGIVCVTATSAKANDIADLLRAAAVADLMDLVVTSDDVDRSKPDPDLISAAVAKVGMNPDEVLLIGDTPYDIEAAKRAGVATIAFRCGGWQDEALEDAIAIYDGPADLAAQLDASPIMRDVDPASVPRMGYRTRGRRSASRL